MQFDQRTRNIFIGVLLGLATLMVFLIIRPYIPALLLGFVLTIIFRPVFMRILRQTGKRDGLAALLSTILVILIILVPLGIFGVLVIREIGVVLSDPNKILVPLSRLHLPNLFDRFNIDFKQYAQNLLSGVFNDFGRLFQNLTEFFVNVVLILVTLYYLFKDGHIFRKSILNALPFTKAQSEKLSTDVAVGIRAVIGGYLLVAIIQGIVSGIGFWIFGLPNPALWGFVTVLAALVPTLGTSLVNIPSILVLFFSGHTGNALGLTIWWIFAVSLIDNFLGPKFISGRVRIHTLLLLFSIIGGIKVLGTFGFILGPLIIVFFWSLLEMFQEHEEEEA